MIVDEAVEPTCTETGLTEGSHCSRCEYEISQKIISALGHIDEDKNHKCDRNCDNINMGEHSDSIDDDDHVCDYGCGVVLESCVGGTASCTAKAICDICKSEYGEMLQHTYGDWKIIIEPTKDSKGLKEATCICGDKISEILPEKEGSSIGKVATVLITASSTIAIGACAFFVIRLILKRRKF